MSLYPGRPSCEGLLRQNRTASIWGGRRWILVVVGIAFFFLYSLVFVWSRIKITNLRYEYTSLQAEELRVRNEERKLTIEWATLSSLSQIERAAKERLGMAMPSKDRVTFFYESPKE